ncbi:caspase, EACC1-associated type [Streptomyces lydicus]|uniref:caspase, EACC1-associated type n=1 Tax=Streptomyces lydicus TaxID=47763 RepID=UPI00370208FC
MTDRAAPKSPGVAAGRIVVAGPGVSGGRGRAGVLLGGGGRAVVGVLSDPGGSRVVLVGVHAYGHAELDDIPAVRNNVGRLRELVRDAGVWGLAEEHCRVLEQPDRQGMLNAVYDAAAEASDTMVLYYAGHGLVHPQSGELHLALPGSDPDRPHTAVRYEELRSILLSPVGGRPSARRKVVVLDCCWSGLALGGMDAGDLAPAAAVHGAFVLTATAATRQALAVPGETYTAFTGEVIDIVGSGVVGGPALLSMAALYERVTQALAAKGRPLPRQSNSDHAGRICLFRNRAHRAGVEGAERAAGAVGAAGLRPSGGVAGGAVEVAVAGGRRAGSGGTAGVTVVPGEGRGGDSGGWVAPLPELRVVPPGGRGVVRLGRYPVTHAQFRDFLADPGNARWRPGAARAGAYADENYLVGWRELEFPEGRAGHPVVAVGAYAARAYAAWAGRRLGVALRLPTAAEWELAARAGRGGEWWSADVAAGRVNFRGSHGELAPNGEFPPNPYGIGDLLGNVWDICVDDAGAPVLRGGAFDTPQARLRECPVPGSPAECRRNVGFRCAGEV